MFSLIFYNCLDNLTQCFGDRRFSFNRIDNVAVLSAFKIGFLTNSGISNGWLGCNLRGDSVAFNNMFCTVLILNINIYN